MPKVSMRVAYRMFWRFAVAIIVAPNHPVRTGLSCDFLSPMVTILSPYVHLFK